MRHGSRSAGVRCQLSLSHGLATPAPAPPAMPAALPIAAPTSADAPVGSLRPSSERHRWRTAAHCAVPPSSGCPPGSCCSCGERLRTPAATGPSARKHPLTNCSDLMPMPVPLRLVARFCISAVGAQSIGMRSVLAPTSNTKIGTLMHRGAPLANHASAWAQLVSAAHTCRSVTQALEAFPRICRQSLRLPSERVKHKHPAHHG